MTLTSDAAITPMEAEAPAQLTEPARSGAAGPPATWALGAAALGALALGALAIGALVVGRLAVGRLAIGQARVGKLVIDELVVRRMRAPDQSHGGGR